MSGLREVFQCLTNHIHCTRHGVVAHWPEFNVKSGLWIIHGYRAE
jgi:hypothetical protein